MQSSEVFGFNYDGSWGTSGLDLWQHHDHGRMAVEVARGKEHFPAWNTARWWLSPDAYQRDPARFLANFDAGLGIFAAAGIGVVPLLFNRWLDPVCDFGGVPLDHLIPQHSAWNRTDDLFADVEAHGRRRSPVEEVHHDYLTDVVGRHRDDDRVVLWDLCNEPLMGGYVDDPTSPARAAELRWLGWLRDVCHHLGVTQPLTIGNYTNTTAVTLTEPLSDVVSIHPYWMWNLDPASTPMASQQVFEEHLDACLAIATRAGKGLLATETVWGARDDATHVEVLRYTLGELRRRGIGFTVHALHHSLVSDLHRDAFGPVGLPECLHFLEADGSLRAGHEAVNAFAPTAG
ncbi:hypothetical protein SAMN04488543_3805 [Friedmanniella luteola]|uniref:Cellulase (Glycosyl hydrolase family 5) n=1 Tax=Friedmanniella luteola TaxID=546871 RepID=A0A1H1ZJ22_9ACTN|nr:hypothetical protein [Friedmanniella luteola]SDT33653.1 hypothetical protein SAMN04488543_3805 [Friedmanniella luteola]